MNSKANTLIALTAALAVANGGETIPPAIAKKPKSRRYKQNLKPAPVLALGKHVGRNAPCPCGSGKKFKRCCMIAVDSAVAEFQRIMWQRRHKHKPMTPAEAEESAALSMLTKDPRWNDVGDEDDLFE